ncbi:hypothetical protein BDW02DRAFT_552392 [Decorospora gaudefroyi]|uniref:Heterokaryon incompatibility domain-containing protein n=1 Tax=Decorospora gaudefroyi TaxID=184978 RepID=A0A6A5KED8_9PLEO|nr:hypothetical protein BDW02DRAFT_552392 [Decorospora gaudefroyi]
MALTPASFTLTNEEEAAVAHRAKIRELLHTNYVGPVRALQASLEEFRNWTLEEVAALFHDYPPLPDRRLYPLGPDSRYPPLGNRRFAELAGKVAIMGAANALVLATSPLTMPMMAKEKRKEVISGLIDVNKQVVSSSLFVSASLDLMEEAGRRNQALCVNKWGRFRILGSSYAAVSHVWAETMGLQFNDEKIQQDERGLLMSHFNKIMNKALQCGYEWIWLDLLAIPKKSDPGSSNLRLTQVKTLIINSLQAVYRNADAVIVLDAFPLNLPSGDPLRVAAALVCGMWLTRIWTYQEAKLARKALIVTATSVVSYSDILSALRQQAQVNQEKWNSLFKTFNRLQPLHNCGINLADIALSSTNRNTENDVDYARGYYALLGLQWQKDWTYEDGIMHIYRSRPQEVAMLASMHSLRGLPQPFSWAPKYLAREEGATEAAYFFKFNGSGLVGPWYTAVVRQLVRKSLYGPAGSDAEEDNKLAFQLLVDDISGTSVLVAVATWDTKWTPELVTWVESIPTGNARIICPKTMSGYKMGAFPSVLLAIQKPFAGSGQAQGAFGNVFASALLVGGKITVPQVQWLLT